MVNLLWQGRIVSFSNKSSVRCVDLLRVTFCFLISAVFF
uniref:Uncharacterized protein n=1 Tax=Anguilla anguilla TaxID=7936 RepID=A0A0E9T836_ANGAN